MKTLFMGVFICTAFILLSCSDSNLELAQKNKETVAQAFEVVGAGDFDKMDLFIADNYVRHCQATPELEVSSLKEFKEFIRIDRLAIPDQSIEVKQLVAEGDLVAFWITYKGTQTGQMGPFPASNKYTELDVSGIHRVENGKIAESWLTWDNITILSQLGHFPPAPEKVEE